MRLTLCVFLFTPLLLFISCTSTSRLDVIDDKFSTWLLAYNKARTFETLDSQQSCSIYTNLSQEDDFILNKLSLIRAHMVCNDVQSLKPLGDQSLADSPWLQAIDLERRQREATLSRDNLELALTYLKQAQASDRLKEKISLLKTAYDFAEKSKNQKIMEDIQRRLYRSAPSLNPDPSPAEYIKVAYDYIYQREFDKARKYFLKIINGKKFSSEEKFIARKALRNSYKTEQKKLEFLSEAKQFARWTEKQNQPARYFEAYLTLARAQWTEGQLTDAKASLAYVEKLLKGQMGTEEIEWIRGRMAEEVRQLETAIKHYDRGLQYAKSNTQWRDRLLFSKSWNLRKLGRYPEAAATLKDLKDNTQDPFDRNKYSFWLAKSLKQAGQEKESSQLLEELINTDKLGYYGILAYRELGTAIPPLNEKSVRSIHPNIDLKTNRWVQALSATQEYAILEKFLGYQTEQLKLQKKVDEDIWLYYLKGYAKAGLFLPLFQQLGTLPGELKETLLRDYPELLFPQKYVELITPAAEKFKVRPELMLSIIRQESAFNTYARSPADALGLMQVIPSVAKAHQGKTGISIAHFEDLYKPEINLPIGASLLADLSKKYRGQFILIAAAYNANDRSIQNWIKTRLDNDPLEFIEDIPFEETRAYVKLVLRNFIFYSRLNTPNEALPFPEWCLQDLQSFKVSTR